MVMWHVCYQLLGFCILQSQFCDATFFEVVNDDAHEMNFSKVETSALRTASTQVMSVPQMAAYHLFAGSRIINAFQLLP